jgi:hypothetical protein
MKMATEPVGACAKLPEHRAGIVDSLLTDEKLVAQGIRAADTMSLLLVYTPLSGDTRHLERCRPYINGAWNFAEADPERLRANAAAEGAAEIAVAHPIHPFVANADTAGDIPLAHDRELHLAKSETVKLTRHDSFDQSRRLFSAGLLPS